MKSTHRRGKGQMARELVYRCLRTLTLTLLWAAIIKTVALILDRTIDLSDILIFAAGAFGSELLFLLLKRVFAKSNQNNEGSTYE